MSESLSKSSPAQLLKDWDKKSKLSDGDNEIVVKLQKYCENRPILDKFTSNEYKRDKENLGSNTDTGLLEQEIENMQQFYNWFDELGEESFQEEKYSSRLEILELYKSYCDKILNQLEGAIHNLEELENKYNLVAKKTGELHQACETLVNEQNRLDLFATQLSEHLQYFLELPKLTAKFNTPSLNVYDPQFKELLERLDNCMQFVSENSDFKDSEIYLVKYKQLQTRGLSLIRNEIVNTLKQATQSIQNQMKEANIIKRSGSTEIISADKGVGLDTYFYVKFRTVAPKLRPLCEELEHRSSIAEYTTLLNDCHSCYFAQRRALIGNYVNSNVTQLCQQLSTDLCSMTRAGCLYLIGVCHNEYQLYQHFFATSTDGLTELLEGFAGTLYFAFRPLYIRCRNIDMLCQLVYLLRTEIAAEQLQQRGKSVAAFEPIVERMLQDVQERLTFLVLTFLRDEVQGYVPNANDLDYPNKLNTQESNDSNVESNKLQRNESNTDLQDTLLPYKRLYKHWYPTLEKTLVCLSKLYLTVDTKIFEGLATEAVEICQQTLIDASKHISAKNPTDGKLFLIKHLLLLREQITPFDINFSIMEQVLDFSYLKDALMQILSGPGSLFSWNSQNPLLSVVQPRIEYQLLDSKKDLEKGLKSIMEDFIVAVTKMTIESLISFLTKSNAFLNVRQDMNEQLRNQAFATPERISSILDEVAKCIEEKLQPLIFKLRLYLPNSNTQHLLTKPIRDQIVESINQLQKLILANYTEDDISKINMEKLNQIGEILDKKLSLNGTTHPSTKQYHGDAQQNNIEIPA